MPTSSNECNFSVTGYPRSETIHNVTNDTRNHFLDHGWTNNITDTFEG